MDGILQEWLDHHKKHEGSISCEENKGLMREMLVYADTIANDFPAYDADTINKATCQTMVLGATNTTTVTLTWDLSLRHDEGPPRTRPRKTSESNRHRKPSLHQSHNQRNPPTLRTTRVGYHVPAGTRLIVNVWKLHRFHWNSSRRGFLRAVIKRSIFEDTTLNCFRLAAAGSEGMPRDFFRASGDGIFPC
ncbi:hypothetical protein ABFS82_03G051300 [Erythranthe guttata]